MESRGLESTLLYFIPLIISRLLISSEPLKFLFCSSLYNYSTLLLKFILKQQTFDVKTERSCVYISDC